jgi:hypothetical protein
LGIEFCDLVVVLGLLLACDCSIVANLIKLWVDDGLGLLFENMKTYFSRYPNRKVVDICKEYDNAYQQELGKSLYDIRLMCAARLITFDIRYPFHILTAKDITFRSMSLSERRTYVAS